MAPSSLLVPRAPNVSVCSTPECVQTAQDILSYVDLNVDPCSDFYQYTCGTWERNAVIDDSASSNGTMESVADKSYRDMQSILEGTYEDIFGNLTSSVKGGFNTDDAKVDKELFDTVQTYYNLCMDGPTLDALGPTPIYPEIAHIENELLPVNDTTTVLSNTTNSSFIEAMALLQNNGLAPLAVTYVYADDKNPEINSLLLDQPVLTLPSPDYYSVPAVIDILRNGLNDALYKILGEYTNGTAEDEQFRAAESNRTGFTRWTKEKIQGAVERYIDIESKLANFSLSATEKQDRVSLYNPYSLSQLQTEFPAIDWSSLFTILIPEEAKLDSNSTIVVRTPAYFKRLNDFLANSPNLLQLQEYFIIQLVNTKAVSLDSASRAAIIDMKSKVSSGSAALPERWLVCIRDVSKTYPNFMGRYYTLKEFGGENERKKADEFITSIHQEWLHKLEGLEWLDNQTRAKAVEKLNLLGQKAAYSITSPDIRSPTALRNYDEDLTVNKTSYYSSRWDANLLSIKKAFSRAGQKFDKDEWLFPAQTVNAYHSYNTNEIVVPAGILQPPFYSFEYPEYLNYGGIGMVIAHEITHAFDSNGRSYDGHGKIVDWWTNDTTTKFLEYSQCFIDQYSNMSIQAGNKTLNVNGKLTLAENIADNGGLNTAYLAYQTSRGGKSVERLQGLEQLSPEALFFVNFGRFWCGKSRPENAEYLLLTDTHSPVKVRVNGAVQNSRDFATTFNCPVGSPMNPEKKCSIW